MPINHALFETDYLNLFQEIKKKIVHARTKAALSVNRELINLYWEIGKRILEKEREEGWGTKIIERLSKDLKNEFPESSGFSVRNLSRMRRFASENMLGLKDDLFMQIPWFHNMILLEKLDTLEKRIWYAQKTIQKGWSRNMLVHWIESDLYGREGKAISNFDKALQRPDTDIMNELLKDPYCFDFLTLDNESREKDLEQGLASNVQKFLLELGKGFAFVGRQFRLEVDEDEYFSDLLFYHYILKCFVVVELKTGAFKPEYIGKLNFYLAALDHTLKQPADNPSIGLLLCKNKKKLAVEYALHNFMSPMSIASYELNAGNLPDKVKDSLPTAEQIEQLLGAEYESDEDVKSMVIENILEKEI